MMYSNKSRLVIQQNITIFLGVDYTILGNQRLLSSNTNLVQLRDFLAKILVCLLVM